MVERYGAPYFATPQELPGMVINSLKHGFPQSHPHGNIVVSFQAVGKGWTLTVADDGVGFPGHHKHAVSGLGTGIVNALATQLDAAVEVTSANPGTLVSIIHC